RTCRRSARVEARSSRWPPRAIARSPTWPTTWCSCPPCTSCCSRSSPPCRSSYSPTTWRTSRAPTSISRATWRSPSRSSDRPALRRRIEEEPIRGELGRATRETLELADVVRAEDFDLVTMGASELTQARLVAQPRGAVLLHHPLVDAQTRRAPRVLRVHLAMEEVRIAGAEQPSALVPVASHGHAGVTVGVPAEGHEQDLGRQPGEVADRFEAVPRLAVAGRVEVPAGPRRPLLRAIAHAIQHRLARDRGVVLRREEVDGGVREVVEAAGVVEIEVRQHDVTDVARAEAEALDLPHRRHLFAELRAHEPQEHLAQATARIQDVEAAEAGIDQHERIRGLDEDAVTRELAALEERRGAIVHQFAAEWTGRDAIEMVHAHGRSPASDEPAPRSAAGPRYRVAGFS